MASVNLRGGSSPTLHGQKQQAGYVQCSSCASFPTNLTKAKNGHRPVRPTSIQVYVAGYGGSSSIIISLVGEASTSSFSVGSSSTSQPSGYRSIGGLLPNGGAVPVRITGSAPFRFGRDSSGSTSDNAGYSWDGDISGTVKYGYAPTAPRTLTATQGDPGEIVLNWLAPSSNGDLSITGYRIEVSEDPTFGTILDTIDLGVVLTHTWTDGDPGGTYYFRVAAKNLATTADNTTSVDSNVASSSVQAAARRWDGEQEVPTGGMFRWDGTQEVPVTEAVRWDGTAEVPLT